jgi:hypothetical protein
MSTLLRRAPLTLSACTTLVVVMLGACADADAGQRARLLDSPVARRLVGTWDVTFTNDPHAAVSLASTATSVQGTMAFTTDHHGPASVDELSDITHEGSYDLDFTPFGWTTRSSDAPAVAIARVSTGSALAPAQTEVRDSLFVVLSPGTERFAVRMAGVFAGDSASGVWNARAYSAGGGAGRFVMRRHAE